MEGDVLHYVKADKTLHLVPPTGYRKILFEDAYSRKFGAHLRDVKVHGKLLKHYWWTRMRDIFGWHQGCLVYTNYQPGKAVHPPLIVLISVEGPFQCVGIDVCNSVYEIYSINQYAIMFTELNNWRCLPLKIRLHSLLLSYLCKKLCIIMGFHLIFVGLWGCILPLIKFY